MTNPATEEPDLIPASGEGANFFDAPALFFMTHEETIRRWADLSGRARQCQADYLRSLSTVIEDLGRGHGLDLIEADQNGWHHLYLTDATTPTTDDDPVIAFEFGWHRKFRMTTSNTLTPYVAVRTRRDEVGQRARTVLLDGGAREERATRALLGKGDLEWPVWRKVVASEQWWADLDTYRDQVITALAELIGWAQSHVQRVVRQLAAEKELPA